jgi:hypothetical protein
MAIQNPPKMGLFVLWLLLLFRIGVTYSIGPFHDGVTTEDITWVFSTPDGYL